MPRPSQQKRAVPAPSTSSAPDVRVPEHNVVPETPAAAVPAPVVPDSLTVRMLVGPHAGQVMRVTRAEAIRLCGDAWQPQAEVVAVSPVETRETR